MALELDNSVVKIGNILHEDAVQNIVEGDIIVPDTKPDVVSVLHIDGDIKVRSNEIHSGTIVLKGEICFKILYTSDDPSRFICNIENTINFEQTVNIPLIETNVNSYVNCRVEHVDCNILNGRKLNIKSILNSDIKIIESTEIDAVSNISGVDNIQMLTRSIDTYNTIEHDNVESIINNETEIPIGKPAIKDILKTNAFIKNKETKIAGGKAVVRGIIEIKSLYIPDLDEAPVDFINNEFPFSEVLDIPGLEDGNDFNVLVSLGNINTQVKEDDDGDTRVIDYEMVLNFRPYSSEKQTIEMVSDAYGILSKIELERAPIRTSYTIGDAKTQSTMRDTIHLLPEMAPVKQVYNNLCKSIITNIELKKDKIYIEGIIDAELMYLSGDAENPLGIYKYNIPFHNTIEIKGALPDMRPEARVEIDEYSCEPVNEREIEIKFVITMFVRVLNEEFNHVIIKVEELPLGDRMKFAQPSMIVYYVQNGDTLWDIAKRYLTTISELIKINNIENADSLILGQQLLIPKI